jgi:uncharacterized membrane protein YfcA
MWDVQGCQWLVLALAALIIGVSKTGLPGIGILAIPMVAFVIPAKASTGLILPMLIAGDIVGVVYYRHHAAWKYLVRLAPWTVGGVVLGSLALGRLDNAQIRPLIGIIVLGMLVLNQWRQRHAGLQEALPGSLGFAAAIGLLAGFTTMVANAAGPIMLMYLLAMRLPKAVFLGTSAWYFLIVNLFKVPFSAHLGLITLESLRFNAMLLPFILAGGWIGIRFARHIPEKVFVWLVQLLAAVGAIKLMF